MLYNEKFEDQVPLWSNREGGCPGGLPSLLSNTGFHLVNLFSSRIWISAHQSQTPICSTQQKWDLTLSKFTEADAHDQNTDLLTSGEKVNTASTRNTWVSQTSVFAPLNAASLGLRVTSRSWEPSPGDSKKTGLGPTAARGCILPITDVDLEEDPSSRWGRWQPTPWFQPEQRTQPCCPRAVAYGSVS